MRRTIPRIMRCSPEIPNMRFVYKFPRPVSMLLAGIGIFWVFAYAEETRSKGLNAYQMVTGDDAQDDRSHWDALYDTRNYVFGKEPAAFLRDNILILPVGRALDIAMGEGRNAVFLAKKGFQVDGVDISEMGIKKARRLARENHVSINAINADLNHYSIKPETYEVIVNINYLQKSLISQIKRGLKKGGMIVYENHTVDQLSNASGQNMRRDYLLRRGELKEMFRDFEIILYRETNDGKNAVASLLARKP
jgi:tellurite methyltransferase